MSFITVKDDKQRKELIDQFVTNRNILKKRVIDNKIAKQEFQRGVAAPLQEPITKQVEELEKKRQKKTDENQSKLINQLQQNQLAIVDKIGDNKDDLLSKLIENQAKILNALSLPAIAGDSDVDTPPRATAPRTLPVDWNKDLDLDILDE